MQQFVQLNPHAPREAELDRELRELCDERESLRVLAPTSERGGGDEWDAPFDLRVARPRAVDLRAMWRVTGQLEPPEFLAALGPRRPILLTHVVTPFPVDGRAPGAVWSLAYEFVAHGIDADTVAVAPSNEVYRLGHIGQTIDLGIEFGGKFGIAKEPPGIRGALGISTSQRFQFEVSMQITLRKVVGSGTGTGSAVWKLFRQNEPLDQPHTLLQTVLVPDDSTVFRCSVKTSATQAGWVGTRLGAKYWPYADQQFEIRLS